MSNASAYLCPYCNSEEFVAPTENLLLSHIRIAHALDPGFSIQCSYDGCSRTFSNFRTYQNHKLRHQEVAREEDDEDERGDTFEMVLTPIIADDEPASSSTITASETQTFAAKWILKTGEFRKLTRTATQGIIEDTGDLIDFVTGAIESKVISILRSNKVDPDSISGLKEVFSGQIIKPFDGLTSFAEQLSYYRKNFQFIEPVRIVLKETSTLRLSGRRRKMVVNKEEIIYIPLLKTLERQLSNSAIWDEVCNSRPELSNGLLNDYCDGRHFYEHPLFAADSLALQLILYYDELELCNPLGSRRKKHKIGAFYYLLGNIDPRLRSKLNNIKLLLLAKYSSVSKFGIDKILEPAIEDIKKLESGISLTVNGKTCNFRGTVSIVSADNPASSSLGGFKQSASAFRFCRHCMGSSEDVQSNFVESQFTLRSSTQHSNHCALLERDDLTLADTQHYSLVYGVNRRALLDSLQFFDVASGSLIPDIMHDILEGALPLEVKLMLKNFVVDQKLFSLSYINDSIKRLNVRCYDGDKPSTLEGVSLATCDGNLHQHAMQMWTLARFLPLAVGHLIPENDEHWENYLLLLEIMDILFARPISMDACGYLEALISDHHSTFKELYPNASITLKMHSMVHMPRLILEFGPLINHWTTRFEAKHKYFKGFANIMGNFKNICYSLAMRHELNQCYRSLDTFSFLEEDIDVGPGCHMSSHLPYECQIYVDTGKTVELNLPLWDSAAEPPSTTFFRANWAKINGTKYQTPCVLVVGVDGDEPIFGDIVSILVFGKSLLFEFRLLKSSFCHHYHAYSLSVPQASAPHYLIKHKDLAHHHPYGMYHCITDSNSSSRYTVLRIKIYK